MIGDVLQYIGRFALSRVIGLGRMGLFMAAIVFWTFAPPFKLRRLLGELYAIGACSLFVVMVVGAFTGGVLAMQGYRSLRSYGATGLLGATVAISLVRGAGPVLTAFLIAARAGSATAAQIGTMRITEQLDALEVMALNPIQYLAVPNVLAGIIAFPLLTAVFDVTGFGGGYAAGVWVLGVDKGTFVSGLENSLDWGDMWQGIIKSLTFAVLVTWICTYKGFNVGRGAEGVSRATTEAVVTSVVVLIVFDYFLTAIGVFQ